MSFQFLKANKIKQTYRITMHGKENDSFLAHHFMNFPTTLKERASAFTSKGSITLEAAFAASFFFFAMLCFVYLFEIMVLETSIKSALHAVAKEVAMGAYINPAIPTSEMERKIAEIIGEERLDDSVIVDGRNGFDCSDSKKYWNTTIMDLSVSYKIKVPVLVFEIPIVSKKETIRVKGWTGYEVKSTENVENQMVYVTDYGIVYHQDMNCTYLELSIKSVGKEEVTGLRNQNGGKYKECTSCKNNISSQQSVYVTDYGDKYHFSLECSRIKRNIYVISLSDVHGLGGCSKCVE